MWAACLTSSRAHQVKPAAMDVDDWPQQLADHGAALQVPPGAPLPPGALPGGLPRLRRLPERKVGGAALAAVHSYPLARPVVFLHQEVQEAAVQRPQLAGLCKDPPPAIPCPGPVATLHSEEGRWASPALPKARVGRTVFVCAHCHLTPQFISELQSDNKDCYAGARAENDMLAQLEVLPAVAQQQYCMTCNRCPCQQMACSMPGTSNATVPTPCLRSPPELALTGDHTRAGSQHQSRRPHLRCRRGRCL